MVFELLDYGKDNAKTGKTIAHILDTDIRKVCHIVERERREGHPICANPKGKDAGYYLAKDAEELKDYCGRLLHRGGELFATRRALLDVLKKLEEQKTDGAENNGNG